MMNKAKRNKLEQRGWKVGSASEFLGLTAEEAKRRDAEIERGDVQTIPAGEAMRQVSEALKKNKK
jgi:hypothetical protein